MANSTWFAVTNEVLRLSLLPVIASVSDFDAETGLQEFQSAAKWFVRLAHKHLTLRLVKHFATRRIPLNIDSITGPVYQLDTGINPSCIQFRTFFNVTANGTQNQELLPMEYTDFLRRYPNTADWIAAPGAPQYWILLPIERTDASPVHKVRIFPTPDANYSLEYKAKILPYILSSGADIILWPPEYEHALWVWSWGQVERALGEGKEGIIDQLARQAANEVELIAGNPDDLRKAVRTMRATRGYRWPQGRYTGWISSPPG